MPRVHGVPPLVWRLAVVWQETVLDVVTLKEGVNTVVLRTGETLTVRARNESVVLCAPSGESTLRRGELTPLQGGHAVILSLADAESGRAFGGGVDSTLFHAMMIGAAVQVCLVSALLLAPAARPDAEAGGGIKGSMRRLLIASGGTAQTLGRPSFSLVGRAPEEAEVPEPVRRRGERPARPQMTRSISADQALSEMRRALHLGEAGIELKETLGDLARAQASAPELGAGVGGLAPKDPAAPGVGNGLLGIGEAQVRARVVADDVNAPASRVTRTVPRPRPVGPVQLLDPPGGEVTLQHVSNDVLDPVVRDHLSAAVRSRHNAVRACYEAWGLAADATREGRLVLELTLLPDGRTSEVAVTSAAPGLGLVASCIEKVAVDWYLGDGLVETPTRMAFPFLLQPRARDSK